MRRIRVDGSEPWPMSISDGLAIDCAICGRRPHLDYNVSDHLWRAVVPEKHRRGAVCLPCLDVMATEQRYDVSQHLERVQFTGVGKTVELWPGNVYLYD